MKEKVPIQTTQIKFSRQVKGYRLIHENHNEDVKTELNIFFVNNRIDERKEQKMEHITEWVIGGCLLYTSIKKLHWVYSTIVTIKSF